MRLRTQEDLTCCPAEPDVCRSQRSTSPRRCFMPCQSDKEAAIVPVRDGPSSGLGCPSTVRAPEIISNRFIPEMIFNHPERRSLCTPPARDQWSGGSLPDRRGPSLHSSGGHEVQIPGATAERVTVACPIG